MNEQVTNKKLNWNDIIADYLVCGLTQKDYETKHNIKQIKLLLEKR